MESRKKILVIGSSNTDMTVRMNSLPKPGETLIGEEFKMSAGGKGANQAVAAKRLGGDVSLLCKLGNDIFGDNTISQFEQEGLDVSTVMRSTQPSGVALILVDAKAENSIAVVPGSNYDLMTEDIEQNAKLIKEADIVLVQLEIPLASVFKAVQMAHEAGAFVIMNPAPAAELPENIFRYIDLMTPNQAEAGFYTGIDVNDETSASEAVKVLREKGVGDVIITMGGSGSMIFTGEEEIFVPAQKVNAVDTTAAGDTFCGALAVAIAEGKGLKEAACFATKASALSVQKLGAQESIPYRCELN